MRWLEVQLDVPAGAAEAAVAVVLQHVSTGFAEEHRRGRRILRVYVPLRPDGPVRARRLVREVRRVAGPPVVRTTHLDDAAWRDAWKARALPVVVDGLAVVPTWWPAPVAAPVVVRLDPGMAFGTGEHPTTRLCLAAVARLVRPGMRVVDVGTGAGVLAIAAARLGAARVVAIDNDPVAVEVAAANALANDVGGRVQIRLADGLRAVRAQADLILANLTADTLGSVIAAVPTRLRRGGWLVISGFGGARARAMARAVEQAGLRDAAIRRLRGWAAVEARRP